MNKEQEFKEALTELFSEINGTTMDYSSCRVLEDGILELVLQINKTWQDEVEKIGELICGNCKNNLKDAFGRN